MAAHSLPSTCKALVCEAPGKGITLKTVPTPQAVPGSAVVQVLAAVISGHAKSVYNSERPFISFPTPSTPGNSGVGRVVAVGPDATSLKVGQLVLLESFITARDDPSAQFLFGMGLFYGQSEESRKLMNDAWKDALWSEYARLPLENCHPLNEKVLLGSPAEGGLGYEIPDLVYITRQLVAYGGLRAINVQAGETVIVTPATGGFSGSAVEVASAMGANVIATGRNAQTLKKLQENIPRVKTVRLTGDVQVDTKALQQYGKPDAFIELTPPGADTSTHVISSIMALKNHGRGVFMGGLFKDMPINLFSLMLRSITLKGQWMYSREEARDLIKLVESGILKIGKAARVETVGKFALEDFDTAVETAASVEKYAKQVVLIP